MPLGPFSLESPGGGVSGAFVCRAQWGGRGQVALGIIPTLVSIQAALLLSFTEGSVGKCWLLELVGHVCFLSPLHLPLYYTAREDPGQ